ncbi:gustatory receptor for sugar taste 64f-like [Diabrotica virgifera virgifera]|uniref:Gustatory receptor n=1 Tax=Diabrotica virgifera virgifera TaxID=50390 RepID=A0ABM5KD92_DIAVI|nr:gustatory receptor for sugar taste 64f-like [Diabrotica virgifera virgifera]
MSIFGSRKWPTYINYINDIEVTILKKYRSINLRRKIDLVIIFSTLCVTVEHSLAISNFVMSRDCTNEATGFEHYIRKQFHYFYYVFDYNIVNGIWLLVLSWLSIFIWNFSDIVLICISIIYTNRFNQINERIQTFVKSRKKRKTVLPSRCDETKKTINKFWKDVRDDYTKICAMCFKSSSFFNDIILFTYACNLLFILIQLFVSLRRREQVIELLYFFGSFVFVVTRTVMVSIYGGWLYESGRAALPMLNAVPCDLYNEEVAMFINQIYTNSPSLSGRNLFFITKGLVLSIAASIITYELVLIQFNQETFERYLNPPNDSYICY